MPELELWPSIVTEALGESQASILMYALVRKLAQAWDNSRRRTVRHKQGILIDED
jgi:hypothetical protein